MPVTNVMPDTPRNRGFMDAPHVSPVTPAEDIRSIMLNRVSWGAVSAGVAMIFVSQLVLNLVGFGLGAAAVDAGALDTASVTANVSAPAFSTTAIVWWGAAGIVASCIGGFAAGRLSGEPRESSAGWHGLTAWAVSVLVTALLVTAGAGVLVGGSMSAFGMTARAGVSAENAPLSSVAPPPAPAAAATSAATAEDPYGPPSALPEASEAPPATPAPEVVRPRNPVRGAAFDPAPAARNALLCALALVLGACAAWLGGRGGAVKPTVTSEAVRSTQSIRI